MNIALDYDQTYTADPALWHIFIAAALCQGHDVRIVTARDDRFDRTQDLVELEQHLPVIWCRGVAKRWYVTHFGGGFIPDVWIDDKPESILENSNADPVWLKRWRETRNERVV